MSIALSDVDFIQRLDGPASNNALAKPVVFVINQDCVNSDFWLTVVNGGGNIRATLDVDLSQQVAIEVVLCNTTTQELIIWIRMTSYSALAKSLAISTLKNKSASQPLPSAPFGQQATHQDSLRRYHFNNSGNQIDATGNEDASQVGSSITTQSIAGFGDSTDLRGQTYYTLSDPLAGRNNFCISGWIKSSQISSRGIIGTFTVASGGNNGLSTLLFTGSNNKLFCRVRNTAGGVFDVISTTSVQALNADIFFTVRYTSSELILYVNGVEESRINFNGIIATASAPFEIGRYNESTGQLWPGQFQEFNISADIDESYVSLQYQNQLNPTLFWTQSEPETLEAESEPVLEQTLSSIVSEQLNESLISDISQNIFIPGVVSESVNESSISFINTDIALSARQSETRNESVIGTITTSSGQTLEVTSSETINESSVSDLSLIQNLSLAVSEQMNESELSFIDVDISLFSIASEQQNDSGIGELSQDASQFLAVVSSEQLSESQVISNDVNQSLDVIQSEQSNESIVADISQLQNIFIITSEQINESSIAAILDSSTVINFAKIRLTDITQNRFNLTDITVQKINFM